MRERLSKWFISAPIVLAFLVSGCATTKLTPSGEKVLILNPSSLSKSCKLLGQVHVTTNSPPGWGGKPGEDLHNKLRNEAAAKNGNVIVIESGSYENYGGSGSSVGTVYHCPEFNNL